MGAVSERDEDPHPLSAPKRATMLLRMLKRDLIPAGAAPSVSVLVVDDHPALRAGLERLLDHEPGYRLLGAVASEAELARHLRRHRADVVVLDYALRRGDGLSACFRLKQREEPPGVVLYSAYVNDAFAVPAAIAQADAIVPKNAPVDVLLDAINAVAAGECEVKAPDAEAMEAASSRVDPDDLPIVGMLFAKIAVGEIASMLGLDPQEVRARALRIIGEMQAHDRRRDHAAV